MNMFARFDENQAMTLQDIKESKRYGRTHGRTNGQRENSIPIINKIYGGYNKLKAPLAYQQRSKCMKTSKKSILQR